MLITKYCEYTFSTFFNLEMNKLIINRNKKFLKPSTKCLHVQAF